MFSSSILSSAPIRNSQVEGPAAQAPLESLGVSSQCINDSAKWSWLWHHSLDPCKVPKQAEFPLWIMWPLQTRKPRWIWSHGTVEIYLPESREPSEVLKSKLVEDILRVWVGWAVLRRENWRIQVPGHHRATKLYGLHFKHDPPSLAPSSKWKSAVIFSHQG